MTDLTQQKQYACAQRAAAEQAVSGLSDREKVHFALALMMRLTDPDAVAALRFAANELVGLGDALARKAYAEEGAR